MENLKPLFSSQSEHWNTPLKLYEQLNDEFHFTLDPCPANPTENGLIRSWKGERIFCNPPYGRGINAWLEKAKESTLAVFLLPARTDTAWWHNYALKADEIRFIRGRLHFTNSQTGKSGRATFPSVILIFHNG